MGNTLDNNLINRQAVLDTLDKMDKALDDDRTVENYKALLTECYKDLQPVTPKEKTGQWIEKWDSDHLVILAYECSKCGMMMNVNTSHYCPNCGARMGRR